MAPRAGCRFRVRLPEGDRGAHLRRRALQLQPPRSEGRRPDRRRVPLRAPRQQLAGGRGAALPPRRTSDCAASCCPRSTGRPTRRRRRGRSGFCKPSRRRSGHRRSCTPSRTSCAERATSTTSTGSRSGTHGSARTTARCIRRIPPPGFRFAVHQFTSAGRVDGIDGQGRSQPAEARLAAAARLRAFRRRSGRRRRARDRRRDPRGERSRPAAEPRGRRLRRQHGRRRRPRALEVEEFDSVGSG